MNDEHADAFEQRMLGEIETAKRNSNHRAVSFRQGLLDQLNGVPRRQRAPATCRDHVAKINATKAADADAEFAQRLAVRSRQLDMEPTLSLAKRTTMLSQFCRDRGQYAAARAIQGRTQL